MSDELLDPDDTALENSKPLSDSDRECLYRWRYMENGETGPEVRITYTGDESEKPYKVELPSGCGHESWQSPTERHTVEYAGKWMQDNDSLLH